MFGLSDEQLVDNLERLRQQLCCYFTPDDSYTCDCKFMSLNGQPWETSETTGCCEIRQAIALIKGQRDDVITQTMLFEDNARKRLAEVRRVLDKPDP